MFLSSFNPIKIYTLYENSVKTTNMLLIAGFLVYEKKFSKEEKNNKSKSCSIHLKEKIEKVRLKMYIKPWNDAIIDVSEHVWTSIHTFFTRLFSITPPIKEINNNKVIQSDLFSEYLMDGRKAGLQYEFLFMAWIFSFWYIF